MGWCSAGLSAIGRVSERVVHPTRAKHRMVHGADEPILAARERRSTVGQRYLQHWAVACRDEDCFDTDLAVGIIEAE